MRVSAGNRARWWSGGLIAAAAMIVGTLVVTATPPANVDAAQQLAQQLAAVPSVTLRGPDDPTQDPRVLASWWDSARARSATPVDVTPTEPGIGPNMAMNLTVPGHGPAPDRPAADPSPTSTGAAPLLVRAPVASSPTPNAFPGAPAGHPLLAGLTATAGTASTDGGWSVLRSAGEVASAPALPGATDADALTRTTGRLFFTGAHGQPRTCTATAVASTTASVIATAGHCLLSDTADSTPSPSTGSGSAPSPTPPPERVTSTNLVFAPGYHDGQFPYGKWVITQTALAAGWRTLDWSQDVAFLAVAPRADGARLQRILGAQGISFAAAQGSPPSSPATAGATGTSNPGPGASGPVPASTGAPTAVGETAVLGYPAVAPFDGTTLRFCASSQAPAPDPLDPAGIAVPCTMTPGYSGGPVLRGGELIGVASHDYQAGTLYAPRLGPAALAAYQQVDQ